MIPCSVNELFHDYCLRAALGSGKHDDSISAFFGVLVRDQSTVKLTLHKHFRMARTNTVVVYCFVICDIPTVQLTATRGVVYTAFVYKKKCETEHLACRPLSRSAPVRATTLVHCNTRYPKLIETLNQRGHTQLVQRLGDLDALCPAAAVTPTTKS